MIRLIKLKDKINFIDFCINYKDINQDNYITISKERKFLSEYNIAEKCFFNALKHGDKIFILEKNGSIEAAILIIGYSDKFPRKYLKILAKDSRTEWDLLRFFNWHYFDEIYAKLKLTNPLVRTLQKQNRVTKKLTFGFISKGFRGKEILLYRPKQEKKKVIIGDKINDNDNRKT